MGRQAEFLGLTNPGLRECIEQLMATTQALKNSVGVLFGELANWQAIVKPTLPKVPETLKSEIKCDPMHVDFENYFANAKNTLEAIKMAAKTARETQPEMQTASKANAKVYDPTTALVKKEFRLDENI